LLREHEVGYFVVNDPVLEKRGIKVDALEFYNNRIDGLYSNSGAGLQSQRRSQ